jgi:hypothetical protein
MAALARISTLILPVGFVLHFPGRLLGRAVRHRIELKRFEDVRRAEQPYGSAAQMLAEQYI